MTRRSRARRGASALVAAVLLAAGCAVDLGAPPELGVELPRGWTARPADAPDPASVTGWWSGDMPLELRGFLLEMVERNHDLRATSARVAQAAAQARLAGADLTPQLGLGLDAARQRSNFIGLPIPGGGDEVLQSYSTTYGVSLDLSWEIDLWGRIRAGREAAIADLETAASERQAALLSLVAQGAKLWFASSEAELQLALARETVESLTRTTQLIEARYRRGLRPAADLRLASSNLAEARANLAARQADVGRLRRQLEILAGRYPDATLVTPADLPALPSMPDTGRPAELITRRPDLAAAERSLAAAGIRVHAARAELYPRLRLVASGGTTSERLADLGDLDYLVWSIAGGLAQPVLDGNRIRAGIDRAEAAKVEASERYVGTVLDALREVEEALSQEDRLAEREQALADAAEHASAAFRLSEQRYSTGVESVLFVLEAERRATVARSALLAVRRARLENRIDLHLALGGSLLEPRAKEPRS